MILSALFVNFLLVLGTFCHDLPTNETFSGASFHDSATSRRVRHLKRAFYLCFPLKASGFLCRRALDWLLTGPLLPLPALTA
jgi:hypothetical protein